MNERWDALRQFLWWQKENRSQMECDARDQGLMELASGFASERIAYMKTLSKMDELEQMTDEEVAECLARN